MGRQENNLYEFGPFRLDAREHVLLRDGDVVPLTPKGVDLLVALVEKRGHVLNKDELIKRIWPDSFVEEANLSHHIFLLRKALCEDKNAAKYIETIPRRGYRFVASVVEIEGAGSGIVVERTRAHIVIEEEIDGDTPAKGHAPGQPAIEKQAAPQLVSANKKAQDWLFSQRALMALAFVGLLLVCAAAYLYSRPFFNRDKGLSQNQVGADADSKIKLTRMTSFGKANSNISSDGKFICYAQNYFDGVGTLWLRQVTTSKEIQLLEPGERVFYGTAFSPDGQFIYYSASDAHDTEGAFFRVPVLGGPPTRLIEQCGSMFTLSADGRRVAFYRYSPDHKTRSLVIAALDGGSEETLLTLDYAEQAFRGSPAFSPDTRQIAFAALADADKRGQDGAFSLFTIDISTGRKTPLTTELWREVGKLLWAYDGKALFFVASRPHIGNQLYYIGYPDADVHRLTSGVQGYGNYGLGITADGDTLVADGWERTFHVWTVGADGQAGNANPLTTGLDDGSSGLATLPDGRIAYASNTGDALDLWTMKPDGTDAKPLTADSFHESDVSATGDGRYLVFASNRAGRDHLFRIDSDGSNVQQLTFGDSSDVTPDCSPDGKWIVYASWSHNKATIWKVSIDGGAPIQLTDELSIEPSFSGDGKLVSCILPNSSKVEKGSIAIFSADGGSPIRSFQVVQFAHYYVTPRWSCDGQSLVFTRIQNNAGNLWRQPLAGGPPRQITNFRTDLITNFAFSRDGKSIVLARGPKGAYVVLIKDFK